MRKTRDDLIAVSQWFLLTLKSHAEEQGEFPYCHSFTSPSLVAELFVLADIQLGITYYCEFKNNMECL